MPFKKLYFIFFLGFSLTSFSSQAQEQIDGIIAIIGEDIILKSDLENQYSYATASGEKDDGSLRCSLLEQLLIQKLLLNKAKQDSLVVNEDQVENEVDRRIQYFAQQLGGFENLEKTYKKSVLEIKAELRPEIRDQLLIDQQRNQILNNITVTPKEVKEFFKTIPQDSLPYLPAEVELHHILIEPPFSEASKEKARARLEIIREEIMSGKDFALMAKQFSMGPSAKDGGSLGEFSRGQMVPEFDDVIFNLREDQVSEIFETPFGFHIAKLHKRIGSQVRASHILILPEKTIYDDSLALKKLKVIRDEITSGEISFEKAAMKYSSDQSSAECGGCLRNPQTGELRIPIDLLDADMFFKVDELEEGGISQPMEIITPGSADKNFHMIFLKKRIPPHVANLRDDYQKLQNAAKQAKQATELEKWFKQAKENIYIEIKAKECLSSLNNWN